MPPISDKKINTLLDLIYETTVTNSADSWLKVYKIMSDTFSMGPGSLSFYSNDKNKFELVAATIDAEEFKKYNDHYYKVSPFRRKIEKMEAGEKFIRSEHCSDEAFFKTEIYQDYFKYQDIFYYDYEVLFKESNIAGGISFSRPKCLGNFSEEENHAISLIIPHIRRAFQVYFRLSQTNKDNKIMSDVLNRIPYSVVVVDRSGKAVFVNNKAEKILVQKDGLQIDKRKNLVADNCRDTKNLRNVLQCVFSKDFKKKMSHGGIVQISRPSGLKPLSILASPLTKEFDFEVNSQTVAILFITDPEQTFEAVEQVLCEIYDLTPAEAKLANILAQGKSIKEACKILEVKDNTARTHLKHIFSKTDTNRQSDLVRLILTGPANLTSI